MKITDLFPKKPKVFKHFKKDNIIKSKMHQDTAMVITPLDSLINWEKKSQKSGNKQNVKKKK